MLVDMTVSRREDGSAWVTNWGSDEQEFSIDLLMALDPRWATLSDDCDTLTVHAANGRREYVRTHQVGEVPRRSWHYKATGPVETCQ